MPPLAAAAVFLFRCNRAAIAFWTAQTSTTAMDLMKIATFNINGIKARIQALTDWLNEAQPDVALLQEIKSVDENFPRAHFEDMGYQVETHGQKSFNGVAILSKLPLEDVTRGLPGDEAG